MSAAKDVTDATFPAEVVNFDKAVLVDFWAAWCAQLHEYRSRPRVVRPHTQSIGVNHDHQHSRSTTTEQDRRGIAAK